MLAAAFLLKFVLTLDLAREDDVSHQNIGI